MDDAAVFRESQVYNKEQRSEHDSAGSTQSDRKPLDTGIGSKSPRRVLLDDLFKPLDTKINLQITSCCGKKSSEDILQGI